MDPLQAKTNFNRICQLLLDKGGEALRRALHVKLPATLATALNSHRRTLLKIRYSVINDPQWDLLYPATGTPDSKKFDITLLTILLRNICRLPSPATGWNAVPPASDTSISADILRIKIFRNEVYGHTTSAQYDDATFKKLWQEISQPLVKLGISQQEIDELKVAPVSPEEKSYIEKLKEWKELEDTLLEKMKDIERQMDDMRAEVQKLKDTVSSSNISNVDQLAKVDFKGKIDGLCEKFQVNTRQWFFDELSRWFADEESTVMILTAGPGTGKSVLSAKICQQYKERSQLAGCHFCDFKKSDCRNPLRILESLACQMCENVDGFRDKLDEILRHYHSRKSLSDAFRVLLSEPLHALDRREPMLIVVDALDESKTDDKSEFLELISDEFPDLPKWIKILITSRPELQVKKKLEHFNPLRIAPQDDNQTKDLKCFVKSSLPHFKVDSIDNLIWKCKGSFLFAYYMVKELKEMDSGIEPNLRDYAPKGISGFYERQFKRLRKGLQPGIFNGFVNVVAASRAFLPIKILLRCMNVSDEDYETRNIIINITSEIFPVYDNYLTVYHKSLIDWLILKGYEEHAFVADVDDGIKRLWEGCKSVYRDIVSMKSVSHFELSPDKKFALDNGGKYAVNVGDSADFHWLVNVRLNALKFRFQDYCNFNDYDRMLDIWKFPLSDELFWSIFQHIFLLTAIITSIDNRENMYLQLLANGSFDFMKKNLSSQNTARDILDDERKIWLEDVGNVECRNTQYKLISFTEHLIYCKSDACSPDKKLLVLVEDSGVVAVFELPSLTMIFEVKVSGNSCCKPTFSPDSSYFLCGSIRSCVCIRKQKEVAFIPGGPEHIEYCSFSSCGKKLVTAEENFLKVWDVEKRELLVQIEKRYDTLDRYLFSSCNKYIVEYPLPKVVVRNSTTLEEFLTLDQVCFEKCPDSNQMTFLVRHLSTDEVVAITIPHTFTWRNRVCDAFFDSSTLIVYDILSNEIIDRFQIDCLPADICIYCLSKLDGTNFLLILCLGFRDIVVVLSLESPEESSVVSCVFPHIFVQVTLSPDHLYVACCSKNYNVLTIRSVDNGETLETVHLQKPSKACWWSGLYLWVVCEGALVRFPYYSKHSKVLGSGREVCTLTSSMILGFGEGVFVFRENHNMMITILKICDNMPFVQKISNPPFKDAAISKDGYAILLYNTTEDDTTCLQYQLWEVTPESGWELYLDGKIATIFAQELKCLSLIGTRNCRRSMWMKPYKTSSNNNLAFFDHSSRELYESSLPHVTSLDVHVVDVPPKFLLISGDNWLNVLNVSDYKVIATCPFCKDLYDFFYLSSKDLLLVVSQENIKYFKIHNLEKILNL